MDKIDKIKTIADHYGYNAQSRQCIEEMAELTQAINKFWRSQLRCGKYGLLDVPIDCEEYKNISEEIADVQIMLWQLIYFLDADFQSIVGRKLDRQLERIKHEN